MSPIFTEFTETDAEEFAGAIWFDDKDKPNAAPLIARGSVVSTIIDARSIQVSSHDGEEQARLEFPPHMMQKWREVALVMAEDGRENSNAF